MADNKTTIETTKSTPEETKATADAAPATTTDAAATPAVAPATAKKKKNKRPVPAGQVHVYATFNNTIITVTDPAGGVLTYSSAGACGFRGSKKGTAYAAQIASERAIQSAQQLHGFGKADVFVKGIGLGREAAVRALANANIQVETITDVTGVAHGGVRPRKARRI
jgi:small subunit ribosomal protein S11